MNPSTTLARWVVDVLVARGVRHVVLAPGSRNAALALEVVGRDDLVAHSRLDERTAGFLALGIAKTSHDPVAVVTTSGTAAANLHPAVLEAAHAGLTLVAVTADRPASLRGTGSNQTTDQVRLYGSAASFADLAAPDESALDAAWLDDGPIHLNVQFTPPLVPDAGPERGGPPAAPQRRAADLARHPLAPGPRTVVVAGDDSGMRARQVAEAAGWPLLAEPTSGARNGAQVIRSYRLLLGTDLGRRTERVVVFGHPTLSRPVTELLGRDGVEVISVRARGRWPARPFPVAAEHDDVWVDGADDPSWFAQWRAADVALSGRIDAFVADQPGLTPYEVAAAVHAAVPPRGLLFVGASNPVRDLDLMAGAYPVGERRYVIANRGLAGIDGTLSTAIGAAIGREGSTRAIAYVGDVTFLHDLTGLVVGPGERRPDLSIVVANDDGGSIFATLEQGAPEYAASYDKAFGTPHGTDLASLCTGLRIPHRRVTGAEGLAHALAGPNGGIKVIEAVVRRDNRRALDAAIRELAVTGVA